VTTFTDPHFGRRTELPRIPGQLGIPAVLSEKQWQQQVVELAELYGWRVYHTYDSRRSNPGFPDLVLVRESSRELLWVELKTDKGSLRTAQRAWLDALETCGQETHVWRPRDFDAVHDRLKPALR
jgi:hypothetical protein